MSDTTKLLLPIIVALTLSTVCTLLGRRSHATFAGGSIALFFGAFLTTILFPSIYGHIVPGLWQDGYATALPFLSTLYTIAHISIWRTFAQPRWLAFLSTLPASWFFASAGFWEVIV